mgnify:CR=1 FL=1
MNSEWRSSIVSSKANQKNWTTSILSMTNENKLMSVILFHTYSSQCYNCYIHCVTLVLYKRSHLDIVLWVFFTSMVTSKVEKVSHGLTREIHNLGKNGCNSIGLSLFSLAKVLSKMEHNQPKLGFEGLNTRICKLALCKCVGETGNAI